MWQKYSTISFPALGIELNPPSYFTLGSLTIHFYGLIIALGLMLAVVYAWRRSRQFGLTEDLITDGVLCVVPFAILCARAYYVAFEWGQYASNPISALYIWKGGLAIYGGVLGAVLGVVVYCKVRKIKISAVLDIVSLGFLIGQAIGRWGNFFNREAFGSVTDSFLRMGLFNNTTKAFEYHHPTFLYESVWNTIGFLILHQLSKKRRYDGQIALGYVAWYGLGRAFIEALRTDSLYWGPFRVSQILAALSCVAAVIVLMVMSVKPHDPQKLFVNQVAAKEAAEKAEDAPSGEESSSEKEADDSEKTE